MANSDFLLAIAEIAIALITFAAIVLVLRQLVGGELSAFHLLILKLFALCGFETIFLALLPLLLNYLGVQIEILWRVASALAFVVIIATTISYWRCRRKVAPDRPQNWSTISVTILHSVAVVGLFFHALGLIYVGSIGPYAIALVSGLAPVATAFFASLDDFLSAGL
jgi:hypothetical protein